MYRVVTDEQVQQQIEALPADVLSATAELRVLLEVDPWSGALVNDRNPDGPVSILAFGAKHEGIAAYLILEDQRRVDLLQITWLG